MRHLYLFCFLLIYLDGYAQIIWDEYYTYVNTEIHTYVNTKNKNHRQFIGIKSGKPILLKANKDNHLTEIKKFQSKLPFEVDAIFKITEKEFLGVCHQKDKILLGLINLSGKTLWKKEIALRATIKAITKTEEEGYLLGGIKDDDMFLCCINKKGKKIWEQSYGGEGKDGILSILRLEKGGYLLGGYTDLYNTEETDMMVMEIGEKGKNKWEKAFGEPDLKEQACLIAFAEAGNMLFVGQSGKDIWILVYNSKSQNVIYEELIAQKATILLPVLINGLDENNFVIGSLIEKEEKEPNQNNHLPSAQFFLMQYKIQN